MRQNHDVFLSDPDWPEHNLQLFWGANTMLAPNVCYSIIMCAAVGHGEPFVVRSLQDRTRYTIGRRRVSDMELRWDGDVIGVQDLSFQQIKQHP